MSVIELCEINFVHGHFLLLLPHRHQQWRRQWEESYSTAALALFLAAVD